ncbi:MAG: hypothetical protein JRH06_00750 [Deltaproteobacteria bacterium]|nr:hypothetical protein [Deltaproteobacteria bacterium]MBW2136067.1 hypothetical protein [Deltaproteobacteria bacterium]
MTSHFGIMEGVGGNGSKSFQCISCGGLITHSDRLLPLGGTSRHLFVNPAGIECDFHTFYSCPGAVALGEATALHSWFHGYNWRMAFCRHCGQHLGWRYEALSAMEKPQDFWGILANNLTID